MPSINILALPANRAVDLRLYSLSLMTNRLVLCRAALDSRSLDLVQKSETLFYTKNLRCCLAGWLYVCVVLETAEMLGDTRQRFRRFKSLDNTILYIMETVVNVTALFFLIKSSHVKPLTG